MKTIISILIAASSLIIAQRASAQVSAEEAATVAMLAADWGQTLDINRRISEGYTETNVFLGKRPSRAKINAYFASWIVGQHFLDKISPETASLARKGIIAVEVVAVGHNASIGLTVRF